VSQSASSECDQNWLEWCGNNSSAGICETKLISFALRLSRQADSAPRGYRPGAGTRGAAQSRRRAECALALARELGDRAGEAAALTGQAFAAAFAGDVARAGALSEHALAVRREVGDTRGLAEVLVGVAAQAVHARAYARGEVLGGEALALFRAMGDTGRIELQVVLHPSPVARRFS
jgi:hypothetical protein